MNFTIFVSIETAVLNSRVHPPARRFTCRNITGGIVVTIKLL